MLVLAGCTATEPASRAPADSGGAEQPADERFLIADPALLDVVRERRERAPFDAVWATVVERSEMELREPDASTWDHSALGHNARIAQAAAFRAWVDGDADAAARAVAALDTLEADIDRNPDWDINIRMPHTVTCGANAVELLEEAGFATAAQADAWRDVIGAIGEEAYARFVLNDAMRQIALGVSQNNHPIRTASAIGYAALADLDRPGAMERLDWVVSELDYLLGPGGQYIQADGVVSEGPHYYAFGMGAGFAMLIGLDNRMDPAHVYTRDCINRQDIDPWAGHGCVDGEGFVLSNPIRNDLLQATADWSVAQRLPTGHRPPRDDSYLVSVNGLPLLTHWGAPDHLVWDWVDNDDAPLELGKGMDLAVHHLLYADGDPAAGPPDWTTRAFEDGGEITFRSGWDTDARWLHLAADAGASRKTLHDHVDGTSFQLAAYGDYLLIDTGYYKPNELDNAKTAHAPSHNVLPIDGEGAPRKGLLTDFGDTDAFLEGVSLGDRVEWAEARMAFADAELTRGVAMVDGRFFVIADLVETDVTEAREHRWRVHLNAGFDAGGTWALTGDGATLARASGAASVHIASTGGAPTVEEPPYSPLQAPHVYLFDGDRQARDHAVVDAVVEGRAPGFLAVLAPWKVGVEDGAEAPLVVEPLAVPAGVAAWSVTDADGSVWLAVLRDADAPGTVDIGGGTLETDAQVVLASDDGALHPFHGSTATWTAPPTF